MRIQVHVPPDAAGARLDRWLGTDDRIGSRAAARRLIDAGAVTVDGRRLKPSHTVEAGEAVAVDLPADEPAPLAAAPQVPVLYSDDSLLVVDKPPGLVVHPAPGHAGPTLVEALRGEGAGGDPARPGIVHRLDRDTSGLLLVARTERAHRDLSRAIRDRRVVRGYLALVEGRPESRTGTIDAPIGRDPRKPGQMSVGGRGSRSARTHFEVAETMPRHTLLDVRLETGRTHQIRAHLAAIGIPVVGDPLYGTVAALGLSRQFLHAYRLEIDHPVTGERLEMESSLPEDLRGALERARAAEV